MITAADMDELENMIEMTLREWDQEFANGFAGERLDVMPQPMEGAAWDTTEPNQATATSALPENFTEMGETPPQALSS